MGVPWAQLFTHSRAVERVLVQMFGKKIVFLIFEVSDKFEGILSFNHILNHFGGMERGWGQRDYMFWSIHMFSLFWMIQNKFKELSFDYF